MAQPPTHNELMTLVLSLTDMNYFYFQQFILDLIDSNYIAKYEKDDLIFYDLTSEGKQALDLTSNIIPGILKLKVDSNLKPYQQIIKNKISVVADFEPDDSSGFYVDCKVVENHKTVFSVRVLAGSREQAKTICDNWRNNAKTLYPTLLHTLLTEPNNE